MLTARIGNEYIHAKGKIILFNDANQINGFINAFMNYALQRSNQENTIQQDVFHIMTLPNSLIVEEWREVDAETCTCGTVTCDELIEERKAM